ncbi:Rieske (2Fe-2S) protein [Streptomyces sp. R11]|uniref:Cytochrome bc1 complex Rieske iron-sulfur subunit n=1 Tax=Streptomyces sp. R11 TaxID=3238625 RepID=A0AB39NDM1_9ACTN
MTSHHDDLEVAMPRDTVHRRRLLMAAGAVAAGSALNACVVPAQQEPAAPAAPPAAPEEAGSSPEQPSGEGNSADGGQVPEATPPLAQLSEVPTGGGLILKKQKVVITRDSSGTAQAFSAICTHQGCAVTSVSGGTINCACHGSKFDASTGQPVAGPAKSPLPPVAVEQRGDAIYPA